MKYLYCTDPNEEFPHLILLEPANFDGMVTHTKLAMLTEEVFDWLAENCGRDKFSWTYRSVVGFKSKEDAMGFILRWD